MGSRVRSSAPHRNCRSKMFDAAQQTSLAPRAPTHLCHDRAASDARHPESLPLVGHSDLTTTEAYVRADPTEKLEAIEAVVPPSLRKGKFLPPDKLLALLKGKP